jgi:hypothetical protein
LRTHWRNPQNERAYQVQISRTRASKLFFISLKAGGVGLNITKASYVLFWTRGGIPLPKSKVLAVHIVLDS